MADSLVEHLRSFIHTVVDPMGKKLSMKKNTVTAYEMNKVPF